MADTRDSRRTNRGGFHSGSAGRPIGGNRPGGTTGPGRQSSGSTGPASPSIGSSSRATSPSSPSSGRSITHPELGQQYGKDYLPKSNAVDNKPSPPAKTPSPLANKTGSGAGATNTPAVPASHGSRSGAGSGQSNQGNQSGQSSQGSRTSNPGVGGVMGLLRSNRKKFGVGGILFAIIGLVTAAIIGLAPFKLVHIFELLDQYFGGRQDHTTSLRVGKIWQAVADKDGNLHYARNTGHPLRDHIYNVNSKRVINDMRARGLDLTLDPKNGHIIMNGKALDGTWADQRSAIRKQIDTTYPEKGYFRRAVRAHRTFLAFGIARRFFEPPFVERGRQAIQNWEDEIKKKIRERLFGPAADEMSAAAADKSKNSGDTAKAIEDLNQEAGAAATAERDKALSDTNYTPPEPQTDLTDAEVASIGEKGLKGAFSVTNWLTQICNIRNLMHEIVLAAKIYRERALAREAGIYLVAAAQFFSGDGISLGEMNALMKTTDGFDQSPAYQRITGSNPNADYGKAAAQYSLDLTAQGGAGAFFVHLSNVLMSLPNAVCAVVTNIFFQIGSVIATVVGDFFTGGGISITSVGISTASSFAVGAVEQILKPMAVNMLAGMTVTGNEPGPKRFVAVVGGASVIYSDFFRRNGGFGAVTKAQKKLVFEQNQEIALEKAQNDSRLSVLDRDFNLGNPDSAVARFAFSMPNDFSTLTTSMMNVFSYMNPMVLERSMLSSNGILMRLATPAQADYAPLDDPLGVTQYYISDNTFNDADPIPNENYILDNPDIKKQWQDYRDKCFNSTDVDPNDAGNASGAGMCNDDSNPLYRRFHIYQMDLGLAGGVDFTTGSTSDLPDDDSAQ